MPRPITLACMYVSVCVLMTLLFIFLGHDFLFFSNSHRGLASSHFFFRLRHVIQPVFDRPFATLLGATVGVRGCFLGRPLGRFGAFASSNSVAAVAVATTEPVVAAAAAAVVVVVISCDV